MPDHFKVIACESMARPVYGFSAISPHTIEIEMLKIGLHDQPGQLRQTLQAIIDRQDRDLDAILLVYGLCGRATDGLQSRTVPLVIPRAHDCITLLLGSRLSYTQEQSEHPGTYWYSQDYLERSQRYGQSMALGSAEINDRQLLYEHYVQKYGQDNADYLLDTMEQWQKNYDRAVLVESIFGVTDTIREKVIEQSQKHGWSLETRQADFRLMKMLLDGDWNEDFLFVPPHHKIQMTSDESILIAIPLETQPYDE